MKVFFSALLLCFSIVCFGQQVHLLKELMQPGENTPTAGSNPSYFHEANDKLFFSATTKEIGYALYVSDGTSAGTRLLKDMDPEGTDFTELQYAPAGANTIILWNRVLNGATQAAQIWVTDGTPEGTQKLKDVDGNVFSMLGSVAGSAVCAIYSDTNGMELWKSNGTVEGTVLLKSMGPVTTSDREYSPKNFDNATSTNLFFSIRASFNVTELWTTDGTADGTKKLYAYNTAEINPFKTEGNLYYFTIVDQMWKTDGTVAGTVSANLNFPAGSNVSSLIPRRSISFNGKTLGMLNHFDATLDYFLWDQQTNSAEILNINTTGGAVSIFNDSAPVVFKGKFYFITDDGVNGRKFWSSDGTAAGTAMVTGMDLPDLYVRNVFASENHVWVEVGGGSDRTVISYDTWASDGTAPFAKVLTSTVYDKEYAITINDNLFISTTDFKHGSEIIKSDGTAAGTGVVKDLETSPDMVGGFLVPANDKLFISVTGQAGGFSIFESDGTSVGTQPVKEFDDFVPSGFGATAKGDKLVFMGSDQENGNEPWVSDGTDAGTLILADTEPGYETTFGPNYGCIWAGDKAFFFSSLSALWVTDGTPAGTTEIKQFDQTGAYMTALNGSVYFFYGNDLWKSDGTLAGTTLVKSIVMQQNWSNIFVSGILSGTNKFYFILFDGDPGFELYVSDGTEAGTMMVKDIHTAGGYFNLAYPLAVINDVCYFSMGVDDNDQLWRSDGTPEGTYEVKKINPTGPSNIATVRTPLDLSVTDGSTFYFSANDGVNGVELWKSDGTEAGTMLVKDIKPGQGSSNPKWATIIDGKVVFFADDGVHGIEPWRSTGTPERTLMVQDLNPGVAGSIASSLLTAFNHKAFFFGNTPSYLVPQLWWFDPSAPFDQTVTLDNIANKKFLDPSFTVSATASSGLPVTFSIVSGPATISGNTITITGAGEVHVKATQVGSDDFAAASADQTFNITKADQTVTFDAIPDKKSDDAPFTLTASSSSSLPITFSITSGPATISGTTLAITGAGTVVVKATQAGNDNYNPASKEQTFIVELVLGLEDADQLVVISPNPATSTLLIQAPTTFKSVSLKDMLGRDVITMPITHENTTIDVGQLSRGMYVVRLVGSDQNIVTRKVILR